MKLLNTAYINFANRTLETIQLNNGQLYYVYNHQGQYYKVFDHLEQLHLYFEGRPYKMLVEFYEEYSLDAFLLNHNC
jgi:hypothetical protein